MVPTPFLQPKTNNAIRNCPYTEKLFRVTLTLQQGFRKIFQQLMSIHAKIRALEGFNTLKFESHLSNLHNHQITFQAQHLLQHGIFLSMIMWKICTHKKEVIPDACDVNEIISFRLEQCQTCSHRLSPRQQTAWHPFYRVEFLLLPNIPSGMR